ncbi:effector-associated domain EAD1-containing protein [Streptomyces sp. NPDC091280]|uniref:effector-associated domain EAD1-containing protein n=1 Tax=Streptomyces sp. NPDC091280 TaxID=3365984 RepID=UPI00382A7BDC
MRNPDDVAPLDQPTPSWSDTRMQELREVLTDAYPTVAGARLLLQSVIGLPVKEIGWDNAGSIKELWSDVMDRAARAKVLRLTLMTVLQDRTVAAFHPQLKSLIRELDQAEQAEPDSSLASITQLRPPVRAPDDPAEFQEQLLSAIGTALGEFATTEQDQVALRLAVRHLLGHVVRLAEEDSTRSDLGTEAVVAARAATPPTRELLETLRAVDAPGGTPAERTVHTRRVPTLLDQLEPLLTRLRSELRQLPRPPH